MTNKKITIEENNGVKHTVVWHDYAIFDNHPWNNKEFAVELKNKSYIALDNCGNHIATALPPLPRNPTTDDVNLLHLYAAHGLNVCGEYLKSLGNGQYQKLNVDCLKILNLIKTLAIISITITHAIDEQGNRVEIAIID